MSIDTYSNNLFRDSLIDSYQVKIDEFEGPLDLLLHLIKKNEIDIYNIPISAITRQYLDYIDLMKELNLDIAGEFLVMASSLVQIKSRMLLPQLFAEEEAEEEDPRAELVRRLLEYQKYKDAAEMLVSRELLGRDTFARKFTSSEIADLVPEEAPAEVELFELIEAFRQVLAKMPVNSVHEVGADGLSIADSIAEIMALLENVDMVLFEDLFPAGVGKEGIIVKFLALLELCKLKMIKVIQHHALGSIWIMALSGEAAGTSAAEDDSVPATP